jgi:hypothetical protein
MPPAVMYRHILYYRSNSHTQQGAVRETDAGHVCKRRSYLYGKRKLKTHLLDWKYLFRMNFNAIVLDFPCCLRQMISISPVLIGTNTILRSVSVMKLLINESDLKYTF